MHHGSLEIGLRRKVEALKVAPGAYDVGLLHFAVRGVYTNTTPVDAYRGAGRPEAIYVIERLMDWSARQLGATRIILMGRHDARTDLGREFGATDVVATRGDEGIDEVRALTGGDGCHVVLEAVGHLPAFEQALGVVRPGGRIARVGVPQYTEGPIGRSQFARNVTITGGVAPVRAYIDRLLPGILDGTVDPGRVFDVELPLEQAAEGYALMDRRDALKVMLRP